MLTITQKGILKCSYILTLLVTLSSAPTFSWTHRSTYEQKDFNKVPLEPTDLPCAYHACCRSHHPPINAHNGDTCANMDLQSHGNEGCLLSSITREAIPYNIHLHRGHPSSAQLNGPFRQVLAGLEYIYETILFVEFRFSTHRELRHSGRQQSSIHTHIKWELTANFFVKNHNRNVVAYPVPKIAILVNLGKVQQQHFRWYLAHQI